MKVKLFSIGFTKKTCQEFFEILAKNKVKRIVDTRINNFSQLAGFAKYPDLEYLCSIHNTDYIYRKDMTPTKELLKKYRDKKISWQEYSKRYLDLIDTRNILKKIKNIQESNYDCFLCSEHKVEECHRSLLLEKMKSKFSNVEICHL